MKTIGSALVLVFLTAVLPAARAQSAPSYDDVVLMINDSSVNSVDIGTYFAQRRGIPDRHVFHFQHDTSKSGDYGETIDSATFKKEILWPFEAFMKRNSLVDSINYIVSTKGCPLRVTAPHAAGSFSAQSSFTDCMALACGADSIVMLVNHDQGPPVSPYWTGSGMPNHFRHSSATMPYYLTTRLDAYTVDQVKNLIRRAETPAYIGQGVFVLDEDPGRWNASYSDGNYWLQWAHDSLTGMGLNVTLDTTKVYLTKQQNVVGYASWGSNDGNAGNYSTNAIPQNTYVNGAIAETYVSTGGRSFNPGTTYGQSLIADLLAEGVTGVKGYTDEPYLTVMAEPHLLFTRMVEGYTLAESYWSSSPWMSWRQVVIGDPKMTWRKPLSTNVASIDFGNQERYATTTQTVTLTNVSSLVVTCKPWYFLGGDSSNFTVVSGSPIPKSLAPHDSVKFTITFRANAYQGFGATLALPYRMAGGSADQYMPVSVIGSGKLPTVAVVDTVTFAPLMVGDSQVVSIDVRNTTVADTVLIKTLTITGGSDFSLRGPLPSTTAPLALPAGQTATFPVVFMPHDTGMRAAKLQIKSTATTVLASIPVILRGQATTRVPVAEGTLLPAQSGLSAAYPNPFTEHTRFSARVADAGMATLQVFDVMGRMVKDLTPALRTGDAIQWSGENLPDGVYVCRLTTAGSTYERAIVHTH